MKSDEISVEGPTNSSSAFKLPPHNNDDPSPRRAGMSDGGYSDGYGSGYDSEVAMLGRHTGHWSYGRAEMSKKAKDTLEETKVVKNPLS